MRRRQDDGMSDAPHMPTIEYVSHPEWPTTVPPFNPQLTLISCSYTAPQDHRDPWARPDTMDSKASAA